MLKNVIDVMNNINTSELDNFFANTKANFICTSDIKETRIDYKWLDVLENTLPNLDKIIRNPRRFIIQEEDVVIVEKTKRVSQETIKHLAQHCENIQDIDENGDVVPKKLLNVRKEDTTDLYENRFIYTLVTRLDDFINRQLENLDLTSNREIKRKVSYKAETQIDNKNINIELKMNEENLIELDDEGNNYKNRILSCYEIIKGFKSTEMIKELIGCTLVKSPIRKTNLILRQPDFQKAFILWEYLDDFEFKDPKVVSFDRITNTTKETKDEFTLGYFINDNALDDKSENLMKYKDVNAKLNNLINEYIYNDNQNIDSLLNKTKELYTNAIEQKEIRLNNIKNIYNSFITEHKNKIQEINNML